MKKHILGAFIALFLVSIVLSVSAQRTPTSWPEAYGWLLGQRNIGGAATTPTTTPTFEVTIEGPNHPIYYDAPSVFWGGITTPMSEVIKRTPVDCTTRCNWKQGEGRIQQQLTQVDGPGMARIMSSGGGATKYSYGVSFTKPGEYTLRFTSIVTRTPLDLSKPLSPLSNRSGNVFRISEATKTEPEQLLHLSGARSNLPLVYATFPKTIEAVSKDIKVTVLDQSVTTDPSIATNKDITAYAGPDVSITSKRSLSFLNPDVRYCIDSGKAYKCSYQDALKLANKMGNKYTTSAYFAINNYAGSTACVQVVKTGNVSYYYQNRMCPSSRHGSSTWVKVSGPGTVIFTEGMFSCSKEKPPYPNYPKTCRDVGGTTTSRWATVGFDPNSATFSVPGVYVLRHAVYDKDFGYQYDDKTVTVK